MFRKIFLFVLLIATVFTVSGCSQDERETVFLLGRQQLKNIYAIDKGEREYLTLTSYVFETAGEGQLIYSPGKYGGYRYGPSIIRNEDGSLDVWFASPGKSGEWDYIRYRHSDDGISWDEEEIVLKPTSGASDHYSVCDPGVVYFNGYYYLGYTSTTHSDGTENEVYVARSKNPEGPYQKWNGKGWGKDPVPIITYTDEEGYWGCGEISFVVKDDALYCYYSWICQDGTFTRLSIADLSDDWPLTLKDQGNVIHKGAAEDSCDVIYVEDLGLFFAFDVSLRFTENSKVNYYSSSDGIAFDYEGSIDYGLHSCAHNLGISKGKDGHDSSGDELILGYAYAERESSDSWGNWYTQFQPIKLSVKEETLKY